MVTELVEPELDCPDPEDPEPVEPEPVVVPELVDPEPVPVPELVDTEPVPVAELVDPELVPAPDDEDVLAGVAVAALVDLVLASAGSWPVTSTVKISPQAARNSATAIAITHLRILRTRSWRAARRVAEVRRSAGRDVRGCRGAKGRSAVCSIPGGGVICCRFQWSSVLPQTPRRAYDVFLRPVGSAYEGDRGRPLGPHAERAELTGAPKALAAAAEPEAPEHHRPVSAHQRPAVARRPDQHVQARVSTVPRLIAGAKLECCGRMSVCGHGPGA